MTCFRAFWWTGQRFLAFLFNNPTEIETSGRVRMIKYGRLPLDSQYLIHAISLASNNAGVKFAVSSSYMFGSICVEMAWRFAILLSQKFWEKPILWQEKFLILFRPFTTSKKYVRIPRYLILNNSSFHYQQCPMQKYFLISWQIFFFWNNPLLPWSMMATFQVNFASTIIHMNYAV